MNPGDMLLAFSDGVTEAMNASDEEFGDGRLLQYAAHARAWSAETIVKTLCDGVDRFAGGAPQADDITVLALRRNSTA